MEPLVWNLDPVALALGPVRVRWYGLLFCVAFVLGLAVMRWIYRREGRRPELDGLLGYVMAGSLLGARLVHCLFYEPDRYLADPIEILKIWNGGLASHGGLAGTVVALALHARRHPEEPFLWLLDRVAIPGALGAGLVRVGNLFNSEIVGRPTDVPWAVVFPRVDALPRHPAMVYEALAYFAVFVLLVLVYRRRGAETPRGRLTGILLVTMFGARFLLEFLKERQVAFEETMTLDMGQLLSLPMIVVGVVLLVRSGRQPDDEAR